MTVETEIDLTGAAIDPRWALRIPAALATRCKLLPCCRLDGHVLVACAVLVRGADMMRTRRETLRDVLTALTYPLVVLLAAVSVTTYMVASLGSATLSFATLDFAS